MTEEGTAPRKTACPAHIAVQGYIKLAAQGRYRDALELIKRRILPCRVRPHLPPGCESARTRGGLTSRWLWMKSKFIADQELRMSAALYL